MLSEIAAMREVVNPQTVYADSKIGASAMIATSNSGYSKTLGGARSEILHTAPPLDPFTSYRDSSGLMGLVALRRWFHVKQPSRRVLKA